ncbi:50S ribosomal protein L6 [Verrucomicrobiota bacterium]
MSRVGRQPIEIVQGVTVSVDGETVTAKGGLGELCCRLPPSIRASVEDGRVVVSREDETRRSRSYHGLARSLIANMVEGVSKGFTRELEIQGVGFRAAVEGRTLRMALGFAGDVKYSLPEQVKVTEDGGVKLVVSGPDKQLVGEVAARIRSYYPAEPYKGKGIRYKDERVRRKVGKTVA